MIRRSLLPAPVAVSARAEIDHGEAIAIHEPVVIEGGARAVRAEYGGYCDLAGRIAPALAREYTDGEDRPGAVRKPLPAGDMGEVLEVVSVRGPTLYTCEMTGGFVARADSRSTVRAVPGVAADTASAFDDGGVGVARAPEGVYASSFAAPKAMVEF